jgi:hypothetical protein
MRLQILPEMERIPHIYIYICTDTPCHSLLLCYLQTYVDILYSKTCIFIYKRKVLKGFTHLVKFIQHLPSGI